MKGGTSCRAFVLTMARVRSDVKRRNRKSHPSPRPLPLGEGEAGSAAWEGPEPIGCEGGLIKPSGRGMRLGCFETFLRISPGVVCADAFRKDARYAGVDRLGRTATWR